MVQGPQPSHSPEKFYRSKRKRKRVLSDGSVPEAVIQAQILKWLETTGNIFWRQQSGRVFIGRRRINLGPEGLPDIVVIVPPNGRVLGLEVKSTNGKLRESQKVFREQLMSVGGHYRVVRTLTQAKDAVAEVVGKEWSEKRRLLGELENSWSS